MPHGKFQLADDDACMLLIAVAALAAQLLGVEGENL
jgi:hypothetical protein